MLMLKNIEKVVHLKFSLGNLKNVFHKKYRKFFFSGGWDFSFNDPFKKKKKKKTLQHWRWVLKSYPPTFHLIILQCILTALRSFVRSDEVCSMTAGIINPPRTSCSCWKMCHNPTVKLESWAAITSKKPFDAVNKSSFIWQLDLDMEA